MGALFSIAYAVPAYTLSALSFVIQSISLACSTASLLACCFHSGSGKISAHTAKICYVLFFGLNMMLALFLLFEQEPNFGSLHDLCKDKTFIDQVTSMIWEVEGLVKCNKGIESVYRISCSLTMFFGLLFVSSLFTNKLHKGYWFFKVVLYLGVLFTLFWVRGFESNVYAWFARMGGMCFLIVQLFQLIDMGYTLHDYLLQEERVQTLIVSSLVLYLLSFVGIVLLWVFYSQCVEGIVFPLVTLLLSVGVTLLSVFRWRIVEDCEGTLFPSAVVVMYCVYLCWSALESNHLECRHGQSTEQTTVNIVLGSVWATLLLMWTTLSVSTNAMKMVQGDVEQQQQTNSGPPVFSHLMQDEGGADKEEEDEEPAWPFHCIMLFASMYLSMLLTDWGTKSVVAQDEVFEGNATASMWVKVVAQWITIALFVWTLIAPAVLTDRDFS